MKVLSEEQLHFFRENGYLPYGRVLSDEMLATLRARSEDIAEGRASHVPPRYIQFEANFRDDDSLLEGSSRLDAVRKMTQLAYFDDAFEEAVRTDAIVDVIEDLLGCEDIKLYCDQLMMKPRFNGTVTGWHQDSVAWPMFFPQDHISCWVALDDATHENGCMTMLPR